MRTPVILYVLALLVRAALVAAYPDPGYTDAYYYVDAARSLAQGNGFNVDVVWIFAEIGGAIPADPTLPIAAFGHWMPLAALVQVPFLALFGPQPWASAAPFVLIGATAAPLTWAIARDAGASAVVAVGAGVLIAIPALSVAFMAQPDNFALFQPLVAGALWMIARGLKGSPRSFVLAGLLAGLATLSRTDGVLVLLVVVLAFAWDRTRGRRRDPCERGRRCRRGIRPRDGAMVDPPARGVRDAVAVDGLRQGPVHPLDRRVGQHRDAGNARPPPRDGRRAADREPRWRVPRPPSRSTSC